MRNDPIEILKLLNKSNCRRCGEATCLAFAGAVFKGWRKVGDCPDVDRNLVAPPTVPEETPNSMEKESEKTIALLKQRIAAIDLQAAAQRIGARHSGDTLTIPVCGKSFRVDAKGTLSSEIHIHSWIAIPLLTYIVESKGTPVKGEWVPFRELKNGKVWAGLFGQMCEKPLKKVADTYTSLFHDMLYIFKGEQVGNAYASDISLVLHPLPLVPILFCYWRPEDGISSDLKIFFDRSVEEHLNIESIYSLGSGFATMFEKIALRHGSH